MNLTDIPKFQEEALAAVAAAKTPDDVENVRIKFLGRNGSLTALMKGLRDVPPADKPAFGQALNALRTAFSEALEARKEAVAGEGAETVSACDTYTWHGETYTSSTSTPSYTSTNVAGCDSVTTLNLTINYSDSTVVEESACDSYEWVDGTIYTESTDEPTMTLQNIYGCDSTVNLHLTINYSSHTTIVDTAENSYEWNGEVLTESGEYVYEGQTEAGCDSIVTLKLTINQVGIADVTDFEGLNIYPNPTTGKLTIEAEGVTKVEVFDYAGRLAATFVNTNQLDISQLPSGTYSLRISLQKGSTVRRVIKH